MANEITRNFVAYDDAKKAVLSSANDRSGAVPSVGTKFVLTGRFHTENGYLDRYGKRWHEGRVYCYFEGSRNGQYRPGGISANIFLRRPFDGFLPEEEANLTVFSKKLADCMDAGELYDVLKTTGCFDGKTIIVKDHIWHTEKPYGRDEERPIRYAVFAIE